MAEARETGTFEPVAVPLGSTVVVIVSDGPAYGAGASGVVPDVVGAPQLDAQEAMRRVGLDPYSATAPSADVPRGTVIDQWPRVGDVATVGSTGVLVVSSGPPPEGIARVNVPGVVGHPEASAAAILQRVGLAPHVLRVPSATVSPGLAVAQVPEDRVLVRPRKRSPLPWILAGAAAVLAALVVAFLLVGGGGDDDAPVAVPALAGLTQAQAQSEIEDAGLVLGKVSTKVNEQRDPGTVIAQSPAKGTEVDQGSTVDITVARAPDAPKTAKVPDVVGVPRDDAIAALDDVGLTAGTISEQVDDGKAAGTVVKQTPAAGSEVDLGSRVDLVVTRKSGLIAVPDVVGLSRDDAVSTLTKAKLTVSATEAASADVSAGDVISQSPRAGQKVQSGTEVGIVVSTGPAQVAIAVPNVVGVTADEAKQALQKAGLVARTYDAYDATVPEGTVVSQAPDAGASVPKGTTIAVLVSQGPQPETTAPPVDVPDVTGQTLDDATTALEDAGFTVSSLAIDGTGAPEDEVIYQTPAAGEPAAAGSEVVLVVSSGA